MNAKLNSYFADFEQVKKMWDQSKNVSYFAGFELLIDQGFLDGCAVL